MYQQNRAVLTTDQRSRWDAILASVDDPTLMRDPLFNDLLDVPAGPIGGTASQARWVIAEHRIVVVCHIGDVEPAVSD